MFYQTEFIVMKKLAEINSENLFPAKKRKLCLCNFWEISIKSVARGTWTWNQTRRTWPSASCPELGCHRRKPWSGKFSLRSAVFNIEQSKRSNHVDRSWNWLYCKGKTDRFCHRKFLPFQPFALLSLQTPLKEHRKTRWHNCNCVK